MTLFGLHPEVAYRSCEDCQQWLYDLETGARIKSSGREVPRQPSNPPPCRTRRGCPKGTPEEPRSLSRKNLQAYWHYQQCAAVGSFPDDPIVRQNAAIIRMAERQIDTLGAWELRQAIRLLTETNLASLGSMTPVAN